MAGHKSSSFFIDPEFQFCFLRPISLSKPQFQLFILSDTFFGIQGENSTKCQFHLLGLPSSINSWLKISFTALPSSRLLKYILYYFSNCVSEDGLAYIQSIIARNIIPYYLDPFLLLLSSRENISGEVECQYGTHLSNYASSH